MLGKSGFELASFKMPVWYGMVWYGMVWYGILGFIEWDVKT